MLTPLDIENKRFTKQIMNGYNVDEVDDFLDEIGVEFAKKQKELSEMAQELNEKKQGLEHYKSIEETLQNTLLMAQSTAEEVKNVAKQKSDQIINEAKQQAEQILSEAKASAKNETDFLQAQIISRKAGHSGIQSTHSIYSDFFDDEFQQTANVMDNILNYKAN